MKKILVIILCLVTYISNAQTEKPDLYHPDADAEKDIAAAIKKARRKINMYSYRVVATGAAGVSSLHGFVRLIQKLILLSMQALYGII